MAALSVNCSLAIATPGVAGTPEDAHRERAGHEGQRPLTHPASPVDLRGHLVAQGERARGELLPGAFDLLAGLLRPLGTGDLELRTVGHGRPRYGPRGHG